MKLVVVAMIKNSSGFLPIITLIILCAKDMNEFNNITKKKQQTKFCLKILCACDITINSKRMLQKKF